MTLLLEAPQGIFPSFHIGGHRHFGSVDKIFFDGQVISQDHELKWSLDVKDRSPSK